MSASPSDRSAAYDALSLVTQHLAEAERALDRARDLRVVVSIDCDDPQLHRLEAALERVQRYAARLRNAAAAQVMWDVGAPKRVRRV